MTQLKEQWNRALRFRDRYAAALGATPLDLVSLDRIPEDRQAEIGRWGQDCNDFGITCCVHLHHLKDWADKDASVPLTATAVKAFIHEHEALQVIADLCNGTKHAVLDRAGWSQHQVSLGKSLNIQGQRNGEGLMVAQAWHRVRLDQRQRPLLEIVDEAIELWRGKLDDLGVTSRVPGLASALHEGE